MDGLVVNEDKCKAIVTGKQRLALEHLVVGQGHLPPEIVASSGEQQISRGIFITDKSIMQGDKENLTLLYYPPEETGQEAVTLIELGPSTNACPQGLCMCHYYNTFNNNLSIIQFLIIHFHKSSKEKKKFEDLFFLCIFYSLSLSLTLFLLLLFQSCCTWLASERRRQRRTSNMLSRSSSMSEPLNLMLAVVQRIRTRKPFLPISNIFR